MDAILLAVNVVLPLIIYMAIGALLRAKNVVDTDGFQKLNRLLFYAVIPLVCMKNIYESDFSILTSPALPLFVFVANCLVFAISSLITVKVCKEPSRRGVIISGVSRVNDALFGLAVAESLLGPSKISCYMICLAISIPTQNILGVVVMEMNRGKKVNFLRVFKQVLTNPVIIGCIVGGILKVSGLVLPTLVMSTVRSITAVITPLAFMIIGSRLRFNSVKENRKALSCIFLFKLIIIPTIMILVGKLLGFTQAYLAALLCLFGSPCATILYTLSCEMDGDEVLASEAVALSHALAILTMFLFITILTTLGVI